MGWGGVKLVGGSEHGHSGRRFKVSQIQVSKFQSFKVNQGP